MWPDEGDRIDAGRRVGARHDRCPTNPRLPVDPADPHPPVGIWENGAFPLGEPVRVRWPVTDWGWWPFRWEEHPLPGLAEVADAAGVVVAHSAIAVPVATHSRYTGFGEGDDELALDYTLVRPATQDEAAPLLAAEAENTRLADLCRQFRAVFDSPTAPDDIGYPLRDYPHAELYLFYRRMHAQPHVRPPAGVDEDGFHDRGERTLYRDDEQRLYYVQNHVFQGVHSLPVTPERETLYQELVSAFHEHRHSP